MLRNECLKPILHCFNCGTKGHNSKSCLRKQKWLRKDPDSNYTSDEDNLELAKGDDLVRRGLRSYDFEEITGLQKKLAIYSRGFCLKCGRKECSQQKSCQAMLNICSLCGGRGHYSKLCLSSEERKLAI